MTKATLVGLIRPLDLVLTPQGAIALVTEVSGGLYGNVAIEFIRRPKGTYEQSAWWKEEELDVLGSIPVVLANAVAHNMGTNRSQGEKFFGSKKGRQKR